MGVQLDDQRPLLTPPGEGETVTDRPEKTLRILGELDELILTWFRYAAGEEGPEQHVHHHHTDAFHVLEGELELTLGAEREVVTALPGVFAAAPPNTLHTFRNASAGPVVFLNLHVPSSRFGDHIRGTIDDFDQHDPPPDGARPDFEGVDPHTHVDHADAFYVLEGEVEFRVGDEPRVVGPGTFVAAPRNTVHGFRPAGIEPIRCLNLHAPPAGFLDRLRD